MWYVGLVIFLISSGLLTGGADAADQAQPIRIGELNASFGPTPITVGLRNGLQKLGYRENEDFVLGVRFTRGDVAALPAAAHDLVQYDVNLILASGDHAAKAAQKATTRIPIVFVTGINPVEAGLVESFARPGGNITGVAELRIALGPKRLEVFQEIIPHLKRVLFLYAATNAYAMAAVKVYRDAAHRLGIALVEKVVRTEEEAQATLAHVSKGEVDGILAPSNITLNLPVFILEASAQQAIPTMFEAAFWVEQGGLASYGPDYYESARQAARLVDKIIKGVEPAEIPVEVNPKIMFAINLQTATALGLTIAPEVLYRADRIIR